MKSISELEGRRQGADWPLIVESVVCPVCTAPVGVRCVQVGTTNPYLANIGKDHGDWHAQRKQLAASIFYHNQDNAEPAPKPEKKRKKQQRITRETLGDA